MQKFISVIVSFVVVLLVDATIFHAHGLEAGDATSFFAETSRVPLIVLTGLQLVHLLALSFILAFFPRVPPDVSRFPRFWIEQSETEASGRFMEAMSAVMALGLPIVGFIYFWIRLPRGTVWIKGNPGDTAGLWWPIPTPREVWNHIPAYRYGDPVEAAKAGAKFMGVDIIPFWQPLACAVLSAAILLLTLRILKTWRERARTPAPQDRTKGPRPASLLSAKGRTGRR